MKPILLILLIVSFIYVLTLYDYTLTITTPTSVRVIKYQGLVWTALYRYSGMPEHGYFIKYEKTQNAQPTSINN